MIKLGVFYLGGKHPIVENLCPKIETEDEGDEEDEEGEVDEEDEEDVGIC